MGTISISLPADGETIDAADFGTPITTIVTEINGGLDNANIKSAAAISGSKIADASIDLGSKGSTFDGWIAVSDAWSYASATTITVPSDATTKYSVGDKIKLVQSASTKYFYITSVASTVLTVNGGTDYTVANSAISGIYYSKAATPLNFPQWFAYTPTLSGPTLGTGTLTASFELKGKTCHGNIKFVLGGTSAVGAGSNTFSLPIPVDYTYYAANESLIGIGSLYDSSAPADNPMVTRLNASDVVRPVVINAAATYATYAGISSTVPFTWATSDYFSFNFTYKIT